MKTYNFRLFVHVLSAAFVTCVFSSGCADYSHQNDSLRSQVIEKDKQAASLRKEIAELKKSGEVCLSQVETLQGLTPEQRKAGIPHIMDLILVSRTGIYPAETDERQTRLLVYFKPIDDTGDAVKVAGAVRVELWELGDKPAEALLQSWDITADQLKTMWSGSLLANFYRLEFPVPAEYVNKHNLTLKLTFTDYFTGKTFRPQMAIKSH